MNLYIAFVGIKKYILKTLINKYTDFVRVRCFTIRKL